jgi:hypothetical protein
MEIHCTPLHDRNSYYRNCSRPWSCRMDPSLNRKNSSPIMKTIVAATLLLLPVFANSIINYSYAQNQNMPSNTTITSNSNSVYSIPSTFVKLDRFSANYTIAGKISSINTSKDLITSTIVRDFDKNPNIGYVVGNSSTLGIYQPGLPNPFVNQDTINQKITNETQNVITAASLRNPAERNIQIKCTFGMILADYKCR